MRDLSPPLATVFARNEDVSGFHFRARTNLNVKVLDFVLLGGPSPTVDSTTLKRVAGL